MVDLVEVAKAGGLDEEAPLVAREVARREARVAAGATALLAVMGVDREVGERVDLRVVCSGAAVAAVAGLVVAVAAVAESVREVATEAMLAATTAVVAGGRV